MTPCDIILRHWPRQYMGMFRRERPGRPHPSLHWNGPTYKRISIYLATAGRYN